MSTTTVGGISGVTTYEQYSKKDLYSGGTQSLGKDTFLKLLTTQMQHQDPLNPMDNSEFVAQLSQFSSLEQLTNANSNLQGLAVGMSSVGNATMVNLMGKEVKALGNGFGYEKGAETLNFHLEGSAESVVVSIYDAEGNLVNQRSMSNQESGDHTFTWDGKSSAGTQMPAGNYTFSVQAANGSESIQVTTYTQGLVDQIDFTTGTARPRVDGQFITVDKIVQILEE